MEQMLFHYFHAAVAHYQNGEYHKALHVSRSAEPLRYQMRVHPYLFQMDVISMLTKLELKESPEENVVTFAQFMEGFGDHFVKSIQQFCRDLSIPFVKLINTAVEYVLKDDARIVEQLFNLIINNNILLNDHQIQSRVIGLVHFWMELIRIYLNKQHIEMMHQPLFIALVIKTTATDHKHARNCWLLAGKEDFFDQKTLHFAHNAFSIVQNLDFHLAYSGNTTIQMLRNELKIYLTATNFHFCYEGDFTLWVSDNENNLQSLRLPQTAGIRKVWHQKAITKKSDISTAKFLLNSCILLAEAESREDLLVLYHTDLADIVFDDDIHESWLYAKACFLKNTHFNEETIKRWKDLGKKFYGKSKIQEALQIYSQAKKGCNNQHSQLKKELSSNISLMHLTLNNYGDAVNEAKSCIRLDSSWFKGYYRLAQAQCKMKRYDESNMNLILALNKSSDKPTDQSVLLFKNRAKINSNDYPSSIKQRLLQMTLEKLHEESTEEAWSAIDNMFTTKPKKYALSTKSTPLVKAIQRKISVPLLETLIKCGANVNEIKTYKANDNYLQYWPLKRSIEMELHHHSACLIFYGALPNPTTEQTAKNNRTIPPIIVATQHVICKNGSFEMLEKLIKFYKVDVQLQDQDGNTAMHIACQDPCTQAKLYVVKTLLQNGFNPHTLNKHGLKASANDQMRGPLLNQACQLYKHSKQSSFGRREPSASSHQSQNAAKITEITGQPANETKIEEKTQENEFKLLMSETDDGLKAFKEKDWKTASTELSKKLKKMRKKEGQEQRYCEYFVLAALSSIYLKTDKGVQVFNWLEKSLKANKEATHKILLYSCGSEKDKILVNYIMECCIKTYSEPKLESAIKGVEVAQALVTGKKYQPQLSTMECTISIYLVIKEQIEKLESKQIEKLESKQIEKLESKLTMSTGSFNKELGAAWYYLAKRKFQKKECDQMAFILASRIGKITLDIEVESLSNLHLAIHDFAFNNGRNKARTYFEQATVKMKDSPKVLCNEWLAIIEESKNKDIPTTFFYIQNCLQIFFLRGLETPKYVQLMKDLALCLGHEKLPPVEESDLKSLMKTIQGIDVKEKELVDTFTKTGEKVRKTKTTIVLNKIALLVVPDDDVEMKGKLCDNLTTHCFNTEQFHDCIIYAKQAIEIKPDSLECYIKWAEALYKTKQTEDGHSVLLKALENCQQKEDKVKICIHIFDLNSRSDHCDTIHLTIEVDLFEEVVKKLLSDDDSKSWKILDNIANYSPMFEDLNKSIEIPLERVLSMDSKSFELKEEFVLKLCKRLHWKKLESSIPTLTKKGFLDTIAQIFIKRGKDRNVLEAPILTATRFVIKTGKLMLLNKVIEQLGQNELLGTAKTAVQECCAGGFTDKKLDALNILFIQTQGLENLKFSHDLRKHLSKNDGRYALFTEFKHGVIDEGDQQNVQSKPDDGENTGPDVIRLDSHLNVDKELGEFISALDVHLRKMSQEQRKRSLARASSLEEAKMRKRIMEEVAIVDGHEVEIVESEMVSVEEDLEDKTFQEEDFEGEDFAEEDDDDDEEEFDLEKISLGDTWEVECTQEVYRVLRNKKVPLKMKKKILKKIRQLATGYWPRELHKRLEGVKNGILLYEAKINKASRIIWEVSVSFSERRSMEQEFCSTLDHDENGAIYEDKIRIWNIALQHDDVPKMIEKIEHSHDRGEHCILRKNLEVFRQKQSLTEYDNQKHPNVYMSENVRDLVNKAVANQSQLALERKNFLFVPAASPNRNEFNILKFYSFTSQVASRILNVSNANYDFPFQVSPLEYAVIRLEPKHRCCILLLGRSGTGKTTCCLYRLWSQFLHYWRTASLSGPQLPKFKTLVSVEEQDEVNREETGVDLTEHVGDVLHDEKPSTTYRSPANASNQMCCHDEIKDEKPPEEATEGEDELEDEMVEDCEHLRQVLVTKNEVLCNEIRKNFKELSIGSPVTTYEEIEQIESMKIEDIKPENYPLFVTAKDLLMLIDNSLPGEPFFERDEDGNVKHEIPGWGKNKIHLSFLPNIEDDDSEDEDEEQRDENNPQDGSLATDLNKKKKAASKVVKKHEVTYEVFANEIWPKLIKKRNKEEKSCHPSLVWMEIKSFIKGSAEAFVSKDKEGCLTGYLTKEEYENIGRKRAPNFEGNRDDIYDIFLRYMKFKRYSPYFDEMDLHFNLYKRLKETLVPEWAFHQVYVDEVQDFTQSELLLLIRSSANPNAMFFTGDTAQSIMSGVAFRFCDLSSLYKAAKDEFKSWKLQSPITVPSKVHQLTHNYRSHAGILKLSSTIIKLLEKLFPTSIEVNAKPDIGLFPGPSPVILETDDFSELAILLQGSRRQTSAIEFGAHQVVLVQNEKSKESLPAELSYGLVLSIYEAKGLEFDDVLLYNFFKDSPAFDEWRVIASKSNEIEVDVTESDSSLQVIPNDVDYSSRPLDFDYNKHKLLNSELKKLYTAVTRARVNVWIFDEDKKKRAPMFDFLVKKKLVDVAKLEDGAVRDHHFAEQSSEEQWDKQGKYFFTKGLWKLAMKCAIKADNDQLREKCQAKLKFELAYRKAKDGWDSKKGKIAKTTILNGFKVCALSFLKCGLVGDAVTSLQNAHANDFLALLYEKQSKFGDAARLYKKAGKKEDAIRCYKADNNHRSVMSLLKSENKFIEALEYQQQHSLNEVDSSELMAKALRFYEDSNNIQTIRQILKFGTLNFQISYLRSRDDMLDDLVQLYQEHKMMQQLARLYKDQHNYVEAAKIAVNIDEKLSYLILAFKEFTLKPLDVAKEELIELFASVLSLINDVTSLSLKAEAYYCYAFLTKEAKYLFDAIKGFDKDPVGQLVVFKLLITFDKVNRNGVFKNMYESYKKFYGLVQSIFDLVANLANARTDKTFVNETLEKIGFGRSGRDYLVFEQSSLKYYYKLGSMPSSLPSGKITKVKAMEIAAKILLSIFKAVIFNFRQLVTQEVNTNMICQVPNHCSDRHCRSLHEPPTSDSFVRALRALLGSLSVSGVCSTTSRQLSSEMTAPHSKWMQPKRPEELWMLYRLLQCYKPFYHIIKTQISEQMATIPHVAKKSLEGIMRHEWSERLNDRKVDINLYIGLNHISYLMDPNNPLIDELRLDRRMDRLPIQEVFKVHNQGLETLYYHSHVKNFFYSTLKVLRRSNADVDTFCDMLEVPIILLFASFSATQPPGRPFSFCVPRSYAVQMEEWDFIYNHKASLAVGKLRKKKEEWDKIVSFIKQFCEMLTNPDGIFKTLLSLFEDRQSNESMLKISRLLCLYLVVLANLQQGIDGFGKDIVYLFRKSLNVKQQTTQSKIFKQIGGVLHFQQAKNLLLELLKDRNDMLQMCWWDSTKLRLIMPGALLAPSANQKQPAQQTTFRIMKRGEEVKSTEPSKQADPEKIEELPPQGNEEEVVDPEDDYFKTGDASDEETEDNTQQVSLRVRQKEEEARQRMISRDICDKWRAFVQKRREKRKSALQKMAEYWAGLMIHHWFLKWHHKRLMLKMRREEIAVEAFIEEHFDRNDTCIVCNVKDGKTREHVSSREHQIQACLYEKHEQMKSDFENAKETYIQLDISGGGDHEMETLLFRYSIQCKMAKPGILHSDDLRQLVDDIVRRCKYLEMEEERKLHEEENEFTNIESRKKKNLKASKSQNKRR